MLQPLAQKLVDDKPSHNLWQGEGPATGGRMQHYTNIERVRSLAMLHPLIDEVEEHKTEKGLDKTLKNAFGRALKGHQSQHDLKFILAASGATMRCGVSVHKARDDLLSLWWAPGGNADELQTKLCEAIFYDVMEAAHLVPEAFRDNYDAVASGPSQPLAREEEQQRGRLEEEEKQQRQQQQDH